MQIAIGTMRILIGSAFLVVMAGITPAAGTYYLDERFDVSVPPPGWEQVSYYGSWHRETGGPSGPYASVHMFGGGNYGGYAYLYTAPITFPQNGTAYIRYICRGGGAGYGILGARFYLCYYPSGSVLASFTPYLNTEWSEATGSVVVTLPQLIQGYWRFTCTSYSNHGGGGGWDIDNCQISDENPTTVMPASLGRVRAVFR